MPEPLTPHDEILGILGVVNGLGFVTEEPEQDGVPHTDIDLERLGEALHQGLRPIIPWRLPQPLHNDPATAANYLHLPLAEAHRIITESNEIRYRIEIQDLPIWCLPTFLIDLLRADLDTGLASIYRKHESIPQKPIWPWPMRFGFLNDPDSIALHDVIEASADRESWIKEILRISRPDEPVRNCGILVLPSPAQATQLLNEESPKVRCGFILTLGWDHEQKDFSIANTSRDILGRHAVSGIAFANVHQSDSVGFLFDLLRELSHNEPIDTALWNPYRKMGRSDYPMIMGSSAIMRESRLANIVRDMRSKARSLELERPSPLEVTRGGDPTRSFSMEIDGMVLDHDTMLDSEHDVSTRMANVAEDLEDAMRSRGFDPDDYGPRFLQCQIYADETQLAASFLQGRNHTASIRIGVDDPNWIRPSETIPFPDDELPPDQEEYELTVIFAPQISAPPPEAGGSKLESKKIVLPRAGGNSTSATFPFEVPEGAQVFTARVIVLYKNRILQTGRLSGVVREPRTDAGDSKIEFEIEALVSRYFSSLDDATDFGHALLFNCNDDDNIGLTSVSGGEVHISAPSGLATQLQQFNSLLSTMAYAPDSYTGKLQENPELLKAMIAFARHGHDVRTKIEKQIPSGSNFDSKKPIQILTKVEGEKIPVEFFYDYEAPERDAKLCPCAQKALEDDGCPLDHDRTVFCPSGFWGINRIIERHDHSADAPVAGFSLRNEPTQSRRALTIGEKALFAGTQEVTNAVPNGLPRISQQLMELTNSRSRQVSSWSEWKATVNSEAPEVLVLLVHTEVDKSLPIPEQKMEVGTGQWLYYADIRDDVVGGGSTPGPILFLIGCETDANKKIEFKTLTNKFKDNGAAIVISSGATINAVHAVPMLEMMIGRLRERLKNGDEIYFGEIMRTMRRELLAAGIPIVLCLTAYGDAAWKLIGPN